MRELDLDDLDSDESDYLLEDKLKRKFMKVPTDSYFNPYPVNTESD